MNYVHYFLNEIRIVCVIIFTLALCDCLEYDLFQGSETIGDFTFYFIVITLEFWGKERVLLV